MLDLCFSGRYTLSFAVQEKNKIMAKDKSLTNSAKRKTLSSNGTAHTEEMMETKVKKKKKKMEVEEAPVIPDVVDSLEMTETKVKKKKKKMDIKEAPVIPDIVHAEEMTLTKVKKKKKKMEVQEAPVIPDVTITTNDRKKKTKQTETDELEGEEDLSPEEKRVLERKMKKVLKKEEKKRLKSEGETEQKPEAAGPTAPKHALDYLTCWNKKRTEWKFQKTRQTWLLQHMFDIAQISDKKFSILLRYMEGLQGAAKDTSVKQALALVEESGQAPEDKDIQQRAHRAREVIQLLS
ncbi:uncharacterized protein C7orf50 homolog [Clinocottus analis]|uniref:uncharacterized protein C7orf50 homolog n=1 Tax=Clinocottus analis TaxID=304258 RepID=UPI0035C1673A